ncbi:MAG: metallophosphoesterase [Bryobacteraceae bacterium]
MELLRQYLLPALIVLTSLVLQFRLYRYFRETAWIRARRPRARALQVLYYALTAYMLLIAPRLIIGGHAVLASATLSWMLAATLFWAVILISGGLWLWLHGLVEGRAPQPPATGASRRAFLKAALPAVAAAPTVLAGAGFFIARSRPTLKQVDIRIRGLHPDLNGLRMSQLTDIHYGPFFGRRDLEYAVAMANSTRPHIALVTGDLITRRGDDIEGCLNVLQALRGDAGVWACHGNHERYAGLEDTATVLARRHGFHVLRGASEFLRFGAAKLNLAGVDYQSLGTEPLVGAEDLLALDAPNVLLCHTPLVFDRAAELGFDLMISGHTHGGQVNLPLGVDNLTFVRLYTPYIQGHYRNNGSQLYVSSGLGTVAVPVRVGAQPEVTLIRLCAA